jgi:hypothetical protein
MADGRVLPREDNMIHGGPLSPDHHRVTVDYVMDGCHIYNLPYEMDGSRRLVDLIEVSLKWPIIKLFAKSIIKLYFYVNNFNVGYHAKKYLPKKKGKDKASIVLLAIDQPQLLDATPVNNLDEMPNYMYIMLMNQPESMPL